MNSPGPVAVTTPSDREITMTRVFNAPRRMVFDALTKPELVRRWMWGTPGTTMPVCEVDLRVGGSYRFVWNAPGGVTFSISGIYKEIVAPERVVSTQVMDPNWTGEVLSTVVLTDAGGKTTLVNTYLYGTRQLRDGALKSPMESGAEMGYRHLDELVASLQSSSVDS